MMDFDMPTLNREVAQRIIDEANVEIALGRKVTAREITRDEALAIPNLSRTEPGRELLKRLDFVRIVEIEGVDTQADGGLHVANLRELGKIVFGSFKNNGSHSKRLEIKLKNFTT